MRTNKGFLELRRLEAARDIATLLASSGNRVMLDSQSLLLNGPSVYYCRAVGCMLTLCIVVAGNDAQEILNVKKK